MCRIRCGLATIGGIGINGGSKASSIVDGAMSVVVGGQWPPLSAASPYGGLPRSFEEVFDALGRSPEPAVSAASCEPLHQVLHQ